MLEISVASHQARVAVTILRLQGDLDAASADKFEMRARQAIQDGSANLLVDLSGVPFMSSAGIRALNSIYYLLHPKADASTEKEIRQGIREGSYKAPHLKLLKPNKRVADVLKMVGLDMYIEIFDREEDAHQAFA